MSKLHEVESLEFVGDVMVVRVDGRSIRVPIRACSRRLANATDAERRRYVVSPSGYGVRWPDVDEDLSIDALLRQAQDAGEAAALNPHGDSAG
jgi:hypothetical protein